MYFQRFKTDWPQVLDEMIEYASLCLINIGEGRQAILNVEISRQLVEASELQPHMKSFLEKAKKLQQLKVQVHASNFDYHEVNIILVGKK